MVLSGREYVWKPCLLAHDRVCCWSFLRACVLRGFTLGGHPRKGELPDSEYRAPSKGRPRTPVSEAIPYRSCMHRRTI